MKNKKIILGLAVVLVAGILSLIWWFSSTVPFRVVVDPNSTISTDLVVTTSKDNHRKIRDIPYSTRVKPGEYTITAWGNGSSVVTKKVTVSEGEKNLFSLLFEESTGENFIELYKDGDVKIIPNANLFPHETADYLITAENDGEKIIKITITAKHRFSKPGDGAAYAEERDIVVKGAKKWLADQGISSDIATTVVDDQ